MNDTNKVSLGMGIISALATILIICVLLAGCSSDPCVSDFRKGALAICDRECDPKTEKCVWEY